MLRIIGTIIITAGILAGLSFSQSMKVHTKTSIESFSLSEIDSITFELEESFLPANLRFANNEVSQWVEEEDGYRQFNTPEDLYAAINGGAEEYFDKGMTAGFQQKMGKTATEYSMDFRVMDFGTAEKAATMYQYKAEQISPKTTAGGYNETIAVIDNSFLSGCTGFAHFGRYYIEVSMNGYGSNKTAAINDAAVFMTKFDEKIN